MAERILTLLELNRATLARQLLLERAVLVPLEAIERLAGLQAQLPNPPYIGLWSRLHAFQKGALTCLLEQRQVVRTTMMRYTLHLATADDYMFFSPALQPLHSRSLDAYLAKQKISDRESLVAEIEAYLQGQPRKTFQLRAKLAEIAPDMDERFVYRLRTYLRLIQVFPGGVWGSGGSPAYTEASAWLGRSFASPEVGLRHLIRRYLAAFGPASVKDMQMWSGLTRLQPFVDSLRPELKTYRDELGRELFDLPDAPSFPIDLPAPVRFLPEFDNLVLAHDDRRRIIADAYRPIVFPGRSVVRPTFLVDGFVCGVWSIERKTPVARLVIEPFEPLSDDVRKALLEEGEQLMHWMLDGKAFEIQCCEI